MAELSVSVVVATRNRPDHLRAAVAALTAAVPADAEVLIVDSASTTSEPASIVETAGLACLRLDRPGTSRARNRGAGATTGDLIVFTDDDCRPQPGWVEAFVRAFRDPRVGFACGNAISDVSTGPIATAVERTTAARYLPGDSPVGLGAGANMAIRRTAFDSVGGFDEVLGPGAPLRAAEETDLFWRLLRAGWEGRFEPESVVVHEQWRTTGQSVRNAFNYGIGEGAMAAKGIRLGARPEVRPVRSHARQVARLLRAGGKRSALDQFAQGLGAGVGIVRGRRRPLDGTVFTS